MKILRAGALAPEQIVNDGIYSLQLRCPSCKRPFQELPHSGRRSGCLQCSCCGYAMTGGDVFYDARLDKECPNDYSRLWALWEAGRLGDPGLVYGVSPLASLRQLLHATELTVDDLRKRKILEIGFGHGRLLQEIQQYSATAYGIDACMPLASSSFRPGTIFCGDLFNIPIIPGQFDLVVCKGVIQLTARPAMAFDCIAEQVAQKGLLFFTVSEKNAKKLSLILRKLLPWSWRYPELVRLAIAGFLSVPRAMMETFRQRTFDRKSFKRYMGNAKLGIFDVISPRATTRFSREEILSWFASNGFEVRRIEACLYVGTKK